MWEKDKVSKVQMLARETYVKLELPNYPWAPLTRTDVIRRGSTHFTQTSHYFIGICLYPVSHLLFPQSEDWVSFRSQIFIPSPHLKNTQFFSKTHPKFHFYLVSGLIRSRCSSNGSGELEKLSAPLHSMHPTYNGGTGPDNHKKNSYSKWKEGEANSNY